MMTIEMIMRIIGMRTIIEMAMMVTVTEMMMMMVVVMTMIIDMMAKMAMMLAKMALMVTVMMMTVCTSAACAIGFSSLLLPSHLPTFLRAPRCDNDEYSMMVKMMVMMMVMILRMELVILRITIIIKTD